MLYLMVILQVLAANNVIVPDWLLCILIAFLDVGETGKP